MTNSFKIMSLKILSGHSKLAKIMIVNLSRHIMEIPIPIYTLWQKTMRGRREAKLLAIGKTEKRETLNTLW